MKKKKRELKEDRKAIFEDLLGDVGDKNKEKKETGQEEGVKSNTDFKSLFFGKKN